MSEPTTHAHSPKHQTPSRRRRLRALAGLGLAASLLLTGTACSDDDSPSKAAGQEDSTEGSAELESVVFSASTLKVCSLVDLKPLATTLTSPGYEVPPENIAKGAGQDPGGPQCVADLKVPSLKHHTAGTMMEMAPARLNIAVVAYPNQPEADRQFTDRIDESTTTSGKRAVADITGGGWTRGKVATVFSDDGNMAHVLVQKDGLLVKMYLAFSSDAAKEYGTKFEFTPDEVKTQLVEIMKTDLFPNVEKALGS